jgi:hypothetical protein
MDLQATTTGDLAIVDGELAWVTGQTAIGQHVAFRLRACLNESRYDQAEGTPWTQVIFRPNTPKQSVEFILEQRVTGTPGVTGATMEPVDVDSRTRGATVTGTAVTIDGEVQFSVAVGVGVQG